MKLIPVPGKTCGSCMMCCKLPLIKELNKPQGVWCNYAKVGQGCTNYQNRPGECRDFYCDFMIAPQLGEEWRPSVARFMTFESLFTGNFTIITDKNSSNSWKDKKYYPILKDHALKLFKSGKLSYAIQGEYFTVILPDRDETVRVPHGSHIQANPVELTNGIRYEISVVEGSWPRKI